MNNVNRKRRNRRGRMWLEGLMRLAIVGAAVAGAPGVARAETSLAVPEVPAALEVPDGQAVLFRAFAAGTQNYACRRAEGGTATWTFRQPRATLVGDDGETIGFHGRGPFWAGYDGSRVLGSAPTSAPAANPAEDVPLLLLRATSSETEGQFAGVTYIQRLDTRGGVAPTGPCDPDQRPTLAVPYLAVYYFYGPA
jgi:hypothetical protein